MFCNGSGAPIVDGSGKLAKPLCTDCKKLVCLHNDLYKVLKHRDSGSKVHHQLEPSHCHPHNWVRMGSNLCAHDQINRENKFKPDTEYTGLNNAANKCGPQRPTMAH